MWAFGFVGFILFWRTKNTVNYSVFFWLRLGRRQARAEYLKVRPLPVDRACWPDLSAYARQPARGPTMLAHLVAILAYVGLSCGQCGPSLGLCWPSLGYVGLSSRLCGPILRPMLAHVDPCWAKRSEKWEQQKNTVKRRNFWWSAAYLGAMFRSWGLCWPLLVHLEPQDPN